MTTSSGKVQNSERGERIRAERTRLGLGLVEFGKKTGVSKGSQILYEKGNPPTVDYLVAAGKAGADIIFILTGQRGQNIQPKVGTQVRRNDGAILATHTGRTDKVPDAVSPTDASAFAFLPFYEDVQAAAGAGAAVISDAAHSVIGFARDLLRESGASPQTCTVIRARGDSMSPTIPDGALLVVDHSQQEISNGYITVIGIGEDILVKRVRRRLDGMIDLISDNRAYEPETLGPAALQQLRVIGRVVYFCRTP